jgi:hypothetical protein
MESALWLGVTDKTDVKGIGTEISKGASPWALILDGMSVVA